MKKLFLTLAMALFGFAAMAQDAPQGKPIITLFGNFHSGINEEVYENLGFEIDRAYLGYQLNFDQNWSAKVVYDMGETAIKADASAANQRIGFLKSAMIGYTKGNLNVRAGLTDCEAFTFQQNFWGYRYVYKSFMDKNGWDNSADLGVVAQYKVTDWFSADLSIFNGEGFKKLQLDNQLSYGLGLTFLPIEGLNVRLYGEIKSGWYTQQELASVFVGYKHEHFRIGAEYNMVRNMKNVEDVDMDGFSIYATGIVNKKIEVYARYDQGATSDDFMNLYRCKQESILGLQYKVNKMFSLSPNFRCVQTPGDASTDYYGYLSALVKF